VNETSTFSIGRRRVGAGAPCLLVAEVALTHDGSLGLAHAFVDAVAATGADAVKFQTHIAEAESTPAEPFRVAFSRQDASRYDYWRRTAFAENEWRGLAEHATERGLIFLSSPFSLEAVDLLEAVGVSAWKVGSGEVANADLLDRVAATRLPVLLSSGLSTFAELDGAVERVRDGRAPVAVLQATTAYPCPPERVGLDQIAILRERYRCPVGLSDHSGTIYPSLAAVVLGAAIIEVHVCLSREMFGPDVVASVTTSELRTLADGVRFLERALATPLDKDAIAAELSGLREQFGRSVVAAADLPAGTVLERRHLMVKKPGTGLAPDRLPELLGRRLRRAVTADSFVAEADVE
jgi:N,N'-diacetyllegionaminate synthase